MEQNKIIFKFEIKSWVLQSPLFIKIRPRISNKERGTKIKNGRDKIRFLHQRFRFPRAVFNCMITPQDFHHRNLLGSKLTNLSIYNGHRIFFICQILANLNCLRLKYMRKIRNVLPQH